MKNNIQNNAGIINKNGGPTQQNQGRKDPNGQKPHFSNNEIIELFSTDYIENVENDLRKVKDNLVKKVKDDLVQYVSSRSQVSSMIDSKFDLDLPSIDHNESHMSAGNSGKGEDQLIIEEEEEEEIIYEDILNSNMNEGSFEQSDKIPHDLLDNFLGETIDEEEEEEETKSRFEFEDFSQFPQGLKTDEFSQIENVKHNLSAKSASPIIEEEEEEEINEMYHSNVISGEGEINSFEGEMSSIQMAKQNLLIDSNEPAGSSSESKGSDDFIDDEFGVGQIIDEFGT